MDPPQKRAPPWHDGNPTIFQDGVLRGKGDLGLNGAPGRLFINGGKDGQAQPNDRAHHRAVQAATANSRTQAGN